MKNIISLLLVSVLLLTATSASADYDKGERGHKGGEKHEAFANLDEDIKAALKEAHESMEEEAEALKEGFDRDEASDEEKEAMKAKMEELREAHHAKVVELLEDYPEVLAAMKEKREEMKDRAGKMKGKKGGMKGKSEEMKEKWENMTDEEKEAMKAKRAEMKGDKAGKYKKGGGYAKRGMYKKKFADKYQSRLENVPVEKLEKVLVKIEAHTEKFKNNAEISAEKKENILAQLGAIADMIKEIVDGTDS